MMRFEYILLLSNPVDACRPHALALNIQLELTHRSTARFSRFLASPGKYIRNLIRVKYPTTLHLLFIFKPDNRREVR